MRNGYGLGTVGSSNITFNGVQGDGTGQTIALIDMYNDPDITTDLTTFDAAMGLPNPPSFKVLNQTGGTSLPSNDIQNPNSGSDWAPEECLDVEWAHTMAPGANIIVFECSSNLEVGDATAAAYAGVSVVSNSWGSSESSAEASQQDPYFTTPSGHAGVTFFASTGDSGAEISYPAESPNVVAVGGTALTVSGTAWSSETTWSSGGGGTSAYEAQPSYQAGTITATKREDPDISLDASPNTGVPICDQWDDSASAPWAGVYGGTSLSSPMMAGLVAVADQGRAAEGLSTLNSSQTLTRLYQLSKANFHDITTGSNGHAAVVGYDEATGIGSPISNLLVPDLAGSATITGRAFVDNAGNGVYGGTDTPIAGQTVYLDLNNDGSLDNSEPSTTTNAQGNYSFADEPAGGTIRLTSAAPTGYSLTSASTGSIAYGATDTTNFTYKLNGPTQVAFTQQPASTTAYGATMSTITVGVENSSGVVVTTDSSTVTLTLSHGTFSSGSNTVTASAVNGVATFSSLVVTSAGTYTLTASDGSLTTKVSNSFTISQGTPTVTWSAPASITYGTPLGSTQLDATASVPGTFAYTPAAGTLVTVGVGQTLSVVFTPTDSTDYTTASQTTTITVTKGTPTLTWSAPASITYGTALSSTQLDATSNADGTFSYNPGFGTVLGAGSSQQLKVTFRPTDTTDYSTTTSSTTITVLQATPTVTWAAPASITYGTALSSTQLDATASVPGTFAYTPAAKTVLNAGASQNLSVIFTPTDTTDYTTANGSTSITVAQATPTLAWAAPASISYGTALSSAQLDATASVEGSFVYTPAAGTVLNAGASQNLSVVFTPTDTTDYTTSNGSTSITVAQATPTLAWAAPASISYGTALSSAQLDATASVEGSFVYTPAAGTVLNAGASQNLSVVFTPTDTTDYTTANGSTSITVAQATPTLAWATPASISYGTALSSTQLDATANVPGSFVYTPPAGTVLDPGADQSLAVAFTPTDATDYTTASATTTITVTGSVSQPINLTGSIFYLKRVGADGENLDIWTNSTATGAPALVTPFDSISSITLSADAVGDSFTADFSNGTVVPSGGLSLYGFGSATSNTLIVVGTQGSDTVTVPGDGNFNLNSQTVSYSIGTIGNVYFQSPGIGEALTVPSGSVTLAPSTTGSIATQVFSSIAIGANAELIAPVASAHAQRLLIQTGALTIAGDTSGWTGTLDLGNNDLDIANGDLTTVTAQVAQGFTTGVGGIISSAAQTDSTSLTTLGVVQNSVDGTPSSAPLYGSSTTLGLFDGANPASTDVLVKFNYFGDANIDGQVDGSDYTRIDNGFNNHLTGWFNGDFNYDGVVDGSDYTLIDNAFNTQSASLASQIAQPSISQTALAITPTLPRSSTAAAGAASFSNSDEWWRRKPASQSFFD